MRFTELSNRKLEVGQYLITAIFDGNSSYLPRETHHTLTINAKPVPARAAARSVTDPDEPTITKTSPPIYFTANSTQFTNYKGRELLFRWLNIETELPLEYTIDGSAGESSLDVVEEDGIIYFSWSDNGNYTLTLTTVENKYFYQKTITMDIIVSDSRQSPMIEYSTTNNPNLRQVGDRLYRYLEGNDGERLHALYHFDYDRPTNPYNLDIEYGMYDTNTDPYTIDKFAGMSNDGSKIRTSKTTGTYVLVARFNGNDSYYPTESRYYISFSSEPEEKITPNLSWSSQTGSYDIYTFIENTPILINPYNVSPIVYSSSNTTVATIDQTGNITYHSEGTCTITATFAGDVSYYGATATYVLIVSDSTPSQEKVSPNMYFINDTVSFEQNASDWYDLQVPVKPNGVEGYYEVLYNGVPMTVLSGKVNVQNLGNYVVRYIFNGNDTYLAQTITYLLVIAEEVSGLLPADLSWTSSTSTADMNSQQNTYPTLTNPHSLPITYSTSDSTIANIGSDGQVFLYGTGEVTISAIFSGDQTYEQQTVTYTLTVTDSSSQRPSPNLSWSAQTGNYDLYTSSGDTITLSNPYSVVVSYDSSNPSVATITTQGVITYHSVGTTIISARYTGSRYQDQTVTYTLTVVDSSQYGDTVLDVVGRTSILSLNSLSQGDIEEGFIYINNVGNDFVLNTSEWQVTSIETPTGLGTHGTFTLDNSYPMSFYYDNFHRAGSIKFKFIVNSVVKEENNDYSTAGFRYYWRFYYRVIFNGNSTYAPGEWLLYTDIAQTPVSIKFVYDSPTGEIDSDTSLPITQRSTIYRNTSLNDNYEQPIYYNISTNTGIVPYVTISRGTIDRSRLSYHVDDTSIATIDSSGNITYIRTGTTHIVAEYYDNEMERTVSAQYKLVIINTKQNLSLGVNGNSTQVASSIFRIGRLDYRICSLVFNSTEWSISCDDPTILGQTTTRPNTLYYSGVDFRSVINRESLVSGQTYNFTLSFTGNGIYLPSTWTYSCTIS